MLNPPKSKYILSDQSEIKLETRKQKCFGKTLKHLKLNKTHPSNSWVQEEISKGVRKHSELREDKEAPCDKMVTFR